MIDQALPGNSVLSLLPIFHGFGLAVCIHTPLLKGMKAILIPQFDARKFGELIKKNKPTFLAGVPTLYEALLKQKLKDKDLADGRDPLSWWTYENHYGPLSSKLENG